jgi:4-amino-4-deoxy-L-arabinose transferase-like glycosyltransferase
MAVLLLEPPQPQDVVALAPTARATRLRDWWGFGAVVLVASMLYVWGLSGNGLGNTFYSAAVRGMSKSWHDFFFAAFDRGGYISVDKPPVAVWAGALSARIFGYSSWSLLLPSALAGIGAVAVLWCTVRRQFGVVAATVAGLVLALTPINTAVNRLNLPEPFMILLLVSAAWATLRALDRERPLRWLVLAGAFVGLGFNTKMLAALVVTPALALAVVLATPGWIERVKRVAVLAVSSLAFSVPWMFVVDLWPKSSRPYVGGSTNNTVHDLVFGYNGLGRVDGAGQIGGGGPRGGFGGLGGAGGVLGGVPGWSRMFSAAVGGQIGWLLPLAAVAIGLSIWVWRRDRHRLATVALWAGWLLLYFVIFSRAKGIFHSYYTSAMGPAIAALVGIGVAAVVRARSKVLSMVAAAAVLSTGGVQWMLARRTPDFYPSARVAMVLLVAVAVVGAVVAVLVRAGRTARRVAAGALVLGLAGLLVVPGAWAISETTNPILNTTLPQAGPRGGAAGRTFGSSAFDVSSGEAQLATWLKQQRQGEKWDLVTTSAMNASDLEARYDLSIMALGGFQGSDPATTPQRFAGQVLTGQVRYVLAGGGGFGGRFPGIGGFPGGFPGGGRFPGSGQTPGRGQFPRGGQASGRGQLPGGQTGRPGGPGGRNVARTVMSLADQICTPVTTATAAADLPPSYSGQILDCAGKGDALLVAASAAS